MRFLATFILRALARPSTPDEQLLARVGTARNRVLRASREHCTGMRLAEAQSRAERWVRRGVSVEIAVARANAWARDALPIPATAQTA